MREKMNESVSPTDALQIAKGRERPWDSGKAAVGRDPQRDPELPVEDSRPGYRLQSGRGHGALGPRGRASELASGWSRVFCSASASAMSAASCCRPHPPQGPTLGRDIPGPAKRLILPDGAALPPGDYSTTPGGTLFGTTPGGTRIIYDRKFLMECRNSQVAKTPPCDLPDIPGVTSPTVHILGTETNLIHAEEEKQPGLGEEAQFDMDI
ncbi:eukaryotic translation initiation factor 4E-binding protein 1 [Zootoca vivipara]|uniref:eukaryotic translation initiation factor 4E-binding protein 1 n=1 Tax=Zootoca vivipara TaxID=8524 RepID=UPI001590C2D0|nr:eukaryotic translation initiation factor 4E-binding protein 1 [Zootoca vivipara]